MTIAFGSQGTTPSGTTASITGTTSVTPAAPASMASGDVVVIGVAAKPDTATIVTPNGWERLDIFSGGAGTAGVDGGPVAAAVFYRVKASNWSSMPTITVTSGTSAMAQAFRYTNGTGFWDVVACHGADTSTGTGWSVTGDRDPGIKAGDMVLQFTAANSDAGTWSSQAVTATGISAWGTVTERSEWKTTQGNDLGGYVSEHPVTTGTSSAAPVATGTASTSGADSMRGVTIIVRLRELTDPDIRGFSKSSNGNTTTQTLSWDEAASGQGISAGWQAYLIYTHSNAANVTTRPAAAGFDQTGITGTTTTNGLDVAQADGNVHVELWKRTTDGSESGTFTLVTAVAAQTGAVLILVKNWQHHGYTSGADTGSDASHTPPSATPSQSGAGVILAYGEREATGASYVTPGSGYIRDGMAVFVGSAGNVTAFAYEGADGDLTGGHSSGVAVSPPAWVADVGVTDVAMFTILLVPSSTNINAPLSDSAPATDSVARAVADARAPSDTGSGTDAAARASVYARTPSDTGSGTDGTGGGMVEGRPISDTGGGTDSLARATSPSARDLSDSAPATDTTEGHYVQPRDLSDSAPATDAVDRLLVLARALSDAGAGTDTIARALILDRSLSDAAPATDAAVRQASFTRAPGTDTAPATDTTVGETGPVRESTETGGGSDTLTRALTQARALPDAGAATETLTRAVTASRPASDAAPATDDLTYTVTHNIDRTTDDSAPAVDTLSRALTAARTADETAAGVDTLTTLVVVARALSEAGAGVDSLARAVARFLETIESAPAVDSTVGVYAPPRDPGDVNTGPGWVVPLLASTLGEDVTSGPTLVEDPEGTVIAGPALI